MTRKGQYQEGSALNRVRLHFAENPGAAMTACEVARQFDMTKETAARVMWQLQREGLPARCFVRVKFRRLGSGITFPDNLSDTERLTVEAIAAHGTCKGAARVLNLSPFTVADHLKSARTKANAHDTVVLVAKYLRATLTASEAA